MSKYRLQNVQRNCAPLNAFSCWVTLHWQWNCSAARNCTNLLLLLPTHLIHQSILVIFPQKYCATYILPILTPNHWSDQSILLSFLKNILVSFYPFICNLWQILCDPHSPCPAILPATPDKINHWRHHVMKSEGQGLFSPQSYTHLNTFNNPLIQQAQKVKGVIPAVH